MHRISAVAIALVLVGCAAKSGAPEKSTSPVTESGQGSPSPGGGVVGGDKGNSGAEPHAPPPPDDTTNHPTGSVGAENPRDDDARAGGSAKDIARADGVFGATDNRFDDSPLAGSGSSGRAKTGDANAQHMVAPQSSITVKATLDKKQSNALATLVKGRLGDIGACREKAPAVKGHLDLTFAIGDKGALSEIQIADSSTFKDKAVADCVTSVIQGISLAPTTKSKHGAITLTF
jgi:hypothetical protein